MKRFTISILSPGLIISFNIFAEKEHHQSHDKHFDKSLPEQTEDIKEANIQSIIFPISYTKG